MANVSVMTGTPSLNGSNDPVLENWNTGDTLVTPEGNPIMVGTPSSAELAIPDNDTTPDISAGENFKTANTVLTTITTFVNGVAGTRIRLRVTDANTIISGTLTKTGRTIVCIAGDCFEWVYDGSNWLQVGGNVGMGASVPVDPTVLVTNWILGSHTSPQVVDLTTDGIRKGVSKVRLRWVVNSSSGYPVLKVRPTGSTDTTLGVIAVIDQVLNITCSGEFEVGLNDNAQFDAWLSTSVTIPTNTCRIAGYSL